MMRDNRGIDLVNPAGNRVLVPAYRVFDDAGRYSQFRLRGGPPDLMERLQKIGLAVDKAPQGEQAEPPRVKHDHPIIAHLWPCPMGVAGAQRFIIDLAVDQARWAEVHVLFDGDGPGEWLEYLPREHDIRFHRCDAAGAARLIEELQPSLAWHHLPHSRSRWALDACVRWARYLVGTAHSWGALNDPSRPSWVIPIIGDDGIRHGVDLSAYAPAETSRKGRNKAAIRVGILGRRTDEKLPDSFVGALERHQAGQSALVWEIAGNSWQSEATRRKTERLEKIPNVEVRETVLPHEVPDWLRSIDVLCVPSSTESVCYAAIEAMACGVPVVARHVDGLIETVGTVGMLREKDADLIAACEELAANKSLRTKLGKAGRERAVELFDVKRMHSQYAERVFAMTNGELYGPV